MARYVIDPARSKVWISAQSSVHPIHSEASGLEGWLDLDMGEDGQVDVTAGPAAHLEFPVRQLRGGNPLEERELKRRIDGRRFPTIAGDLTSMRTADAGGQYLVGGDVTFRGATNHYEDTVTITEAGDGTLNVQGASQFDIRDFGMEPPKILMLRVHPDVSVRVDITARREA